ncbi:hypothetical protein F511_32583 [Dorcoceras hygrometricum]|uniref:Uncharacterized protein n=1 Tax=Dorcoceras hygrometricum TaxID=472368 RepID=A0A2Z7CQJ0_9LAMI|nr:hypothetical protein F511_32583 [Dorcoceras hygrometricum]
MAEYSPTDCSTSVRSAVVFSLVTKLHATAAGGNDMLEAGLPNGWVDQKMSYQLIQTTSFAMHPRLVKYNAEALVWMYCSCLLVTCDCWLSTQRASAESLASLLIDLPVRRRFSLALLFTTAERFSSAADHCSFLLNGDVTFDVIYAWRSS